MENKWLKDAQVTGVNTVLLQSMSKYRIIPQYLVGTLFALITRSVQRGMGGSASGSAEM